MARPLKCGLDYFPLDISFDDDIELIEAEHGLEGFAILIKLWQKIYSSGYYIEWNSDSELLFSKKINSEKTKVSSVVNSCLLRNIFSMNLYDKYNILTSSGIQKRYLLACSSSKRKIIALERRFILVEDKYQQLITEFIEIPPEETLINPSESTQKKERVKESKVKESKERIENEDDFLSLNAAGICSYYSTLKPSESIASHIDFIKICISDYSYEWTKEVVKMCVAKKGKFIKPWILTVLTNWKNEGKEIIPNGEDSRDSESTNNGNKAVKYDFKAYES